VTAVSSSVSLGAGRSHPLIQVKSRDEALEWTKRSPNPAAHGREGEIEMRQPFEPEDFGPSAAIERFREMGGWDEDVVAVRRVNKDSRGACGFQAARAHARGDRWCARVVRAPGPDGRRA